MPARKEKRPLSHTLLAGGTAGLVESSICHPLDTIKTRMQLRNNHVESVSNRLKHSLVEPAVFHMRHSLVEPALRLKHSFVEPANLIQLRHQHSFLEPSLIRFGTDTMSTANGTATASNPAINHNSGGPIGSKASATGGNTFVSDTRCVASRVADSAGGDRAIADSVRTKNGSLPLTKSATAVNNSAAKCWWNLPQQNHKKKITVNSSRRTFQSCVQTTSTGIPRSMIINSTVMNKGATTFTALGCGSRDKVFAAAYTEITKKHSLQFTTSASPMGKDAARCWWHQPNHDPPKSMSSTADATNRSFQTRRVLGPLTNSKDASRPKSADFASQSKGMVNSGNSSSSSSSNNKRANFHPNSTAWWNWHKNLPSTIAGRGHSSKSSAWWQPMNESYGRRTHATLVNSKPTSVTFRKGPMGPIQTARKIIQKEGFLSLYKGLSAVYVGIIPKMAIRFVSFEHYQDMIKLHGSLGTGATNFTAGLLSGLTEAVLIVTPADVCKIRMQSQRHSLLDPLEANARKYGNVIQTAVRIVREEGCSALYKGVVPTMLRQGCNQAVNFTAYNAIKSYWLERQRQQCLEQRGRRSEEEDAREELSGQQHQQLSGAMSLLIGGLSGAMGPVVNNPLDVVKTRLQKQNTAKNTNIPPKYTGLVQACFRIANEEGAGALWKGITPRLMRIVPGQAITFTTYEAVCRWL